MIFTNMAANSSTTDATTYTTLSITPKANTLILLSFESRTATPPATNPTVTGCNLTWVEINNISNPTGNRRITVFRALGNAPTTGTVTIDCGGQTQTAAVLDITEVSGTDISGTDGSGAIVQSATLLGPSATGTTITLAAFSSVNNVAFGAIMHVVNENTNPGSGFTEISDQGHSDAGGSSRLLTEYKINDTTVDASWATSSGNLSVALEIKNAVGRPMLCLLGVGT